MNILCRMGWHKWSSESFEFESMIDGNLIKGSVKKRRKCLRCNKIKQIKISTNESIWMENSLEKEIEMCRKIQAQNILAEIYNTDNAQGRE